MVSQRISLSLKGKHIAVMCGLPSGITVQDEITEFCLMCKNEFLRDPDRDVPIQAVPACSIACVNRYDMIVRKHLGLDENTDDQLPSTSRGRGGGTPVPLPRVSCSPSDSESST